MIDKSQERMGSMPWASYAAAAWCLLFGALHLYWGLGGNWGLAALSMPPNQTAALTRDPVYIGMAWAVAVMCAVGIAAALALIQPWGRRIPRWLPLTILWIACGMCLLRGIGNPVQTLLIISGVIPFAPLDGPLAEAWYRWLLMDSTLFAPWFSLGGFVFGAAAWSGRRRADGTGGRDTFRKGSASVAPG